MKTSVAKQIRWRVTKGTATAIQSLATQAKDLTYISRSPRCWTCMQLTLLATRNSALFYRSRVIFVQRSNSLPCIDTACSLQQWAMVYLPLEHQLDLVHRRHAAPHIEARPFDFRLVYDMTHLLDPQADLIEAGQDAEVSARSRHSCLPPKSCSSTMARFASGRHVCLRSRPEGRTPRYFLD